MKFRVFKFIIIIIIIIIIITTTTYLLTYLLTVNELSLGGSSPYTSTDKTNKNIYIYINETVHTIQNTVNTSTHVTKTPTLYKTHTCTHKLNTRYTPNEIVTIQSSTLSIRSP